MCVKTAIATQRNTSVQHKPSRRNTSLSTVSAMLPSCASHLQCPMTVILALHLVTCMAQIDVGDQKPDRFHWVSGVVPMGLNMPVTALNSGTTGDFDGNGFDDILVIGNMGGFVAWNSTQGLAPFRQITEMGMDGSRCEWDSTLQLVWLERRTPHGIEAWKFNGQASSKLAEFEGAPQTWRVSPGLGVTSIGMDGRQLELLRGDGTRQQITQQASSLADALITAVEGKPGILLVQDRERLRLGISTVENGRWSPVQWWDDTEGTIQWTAFPMDAGQYLLFGSKANQAWSHLLNVNGQRHQSWINEKRFNRLLEFDQTPVMNADQKSLLIAKRNLITSGLTVLKIDVFTGVFRDALQLAAAEPYPFILSMDIDGNGALDFIHPNGGGTHWTYYLNWGLGSQAWIRHVAPGEDLKTVPTGKLHRHWQTAIDSISSIEEVWLHRGKLLFRHSGRWWQAQLQETALMEASRISYNTPTPQPDAPLQLRVTTLEGIWDPRQPRESNPGLIEIEAHQWHHFVYTRTPELETKIWYDGECLFEGKSKDLPYAHNALVFGASMMKEYRNHAAITLDRVILSGRSWTPEEIAEESRCTGSLREDRFTVKVWDMETASSEGFAASKHLDMSSKPTSTAGVSDLALSFDGDDDLLRSFAPVPNGTVTLGFHFRMDEPMASDVQTLLQLYGLYNIEINAVRTSSAPLQSQIANGAGKIKTEPPVKIVPAAWPPGASPFILDETLYLMDRDGQIRAEAPFGWEAIEPSPSGVEFAVDQHWTRGSSLYVMDRAGELWEWQSTKGWTNTAYSVPHGSDFDMVPVCDGVLMEFDGAWHWTGDEFGTSLVPVDSLFQPTAITWSPIGDIVHFSGRSIPWSDERRSLAMQPVAPILLRRTSPLTLVLSALGLMAFAAVGLLWKRKQAQRAALSQDHLPPLPEALKLPLSRIAQFKEEEMDTLIFDEMLGIGDIETDETKRSRRSRFIRECNLWGEGLIEGLVIQRVKDPTDRRRTLYRLHPQVRRTVLHRT